jgi:chromosome segregation ATPase
MNRFLQWFNLFGVVCLMALSAMQWNLNRLANVKAAHLETIRLQQVQDLADRDKTIQGLTSDLDDFRSRLTLAESQLKELEDKLYKMTQARDQLIKQRDQLTAERDTLKKTLDEWVAAVTIRDQALRKAGDDMKKLAEQRNDVINQFNALAVRYNKVVESINTTHSPSTRPSTAPLP